MALSPNLDLIELDRLWADPNTANLKGRGLSTVIIDSGIDLDHRAFGPDRNRDGIADRIIYQHDFADNDTNANDRNGHGTHVASIAAGVNGVAPQANIIALKVFTDRGAGGFRDIEEALQWVIANAAEYNIATINMSLSDGRNHSSQQRLYAISDELQTLKDLDIITVSASGNRFITFSSQQGVGYPAADPSVINVGSVYDSNLGLRRYTSGATAYRTAPDVIAPYSNRSNNLNTLFAPGSKIRGAYRDNRYEYMSGTSMATPHVSGAVLLAQQYAIQNLGRRLTFDEVDDLLQNSGKRIIDGDDELDNVTNTRATYRRLDVYQLTQDILDLAPRSSQTISNFSIKQVFEQRQLNQVNELINIAAQCDLG